MGDGISDAIRDSRAAVSRHEAILKSRSDAIEFMMSLQNEIHSTAKEKGWWKELDELHAELPEEPRLHAHVDLLYKATRTMLAVSELSEGIEALRAGNPPDDKVPFYDGFTVECADAVIRLFDLAGKFNMKLAEAIVAKIEYNKSRSYKHGGKTV